jgi:hypothetical protein
MPLSDHFTSMTQRLAAKVITVDPATSRLEAVGRDGAVIQVDVSGEMNPGFVWPRQNEIWMLHRENISWRLGGKMPDSEDRRKASDLQPGEAMGPRKYCETIGNGATTVFTIFHDLATLDIGSVTGRTTAVSPYTIVTFTWVILDPDHIRLTFGSPPALNGARITVIG